MAEPSTTGDNGGRDAGGRFGPGNKCAKGNPYARRVARLRSALVRAVRPHDLTEIVRKLIAKAKAGDVVAARELFGRVLGAPLAADIEDRLTRLEDLLEAKE
jgi:hypothetical protein